MPKKTEIAKYTLASYSIYNWSHVFVRYELDDQDEYESFDAYILDLFPNAIILHERSDSQADYKKSIQILEELNDDWIFYSANNDHPMIAADIFELDKLVEKAESYKSKYNFISIIYSHFSEVSNLANKKSPINWLFGADVEVIEDDDLCTTIVRHDGDNSSIQIVNMNLMRYWFDSQNLGDARIIRSENIREHFITHEQLMLIPKNEICAHFDGYPHTHYSVIEIKQYQVPPLFIPNGFFEGDIKISYGYSDYREGWVNINPKAKEYVFEDLHAGTDLKISMDAIPLFWRGRISKIDINKSAIDLQVYIERNKEIKLDPYSISNKKFNLDTIRYVFRLIAFKIKRQVNLIFI